MRTLFCLAAASLVLAACASSDPPARAGDDAAMAPMAVQSGPPTPLAGQPTYASPDDAVSALSKAAQAKDLRTMATIVGLPMEDAGVGDPARDPQLAERFAAAYDDYHKLVISPKNPQQARLFIGKDNYPVASPLVYMDGKWFFDSAGGKQELLARIVGENELNTIGVCRAYVVAQYEYYSEDRNGDDVLQYAQHLASTRATHDGLYWKTSDKEPESPLGRLVAEAKSEGYLRGSARSLDAPKPYHGYLFQILTRQGTHAAGGAYDYVINGRMVAGFALVAYPAKYGKSGVMTFEVGANGKVYEKDLGKDTAEQAASITVYDPGDGWTLVKD